MQKLIIRTANEGYRNLTTNFSFGKLVFVNGVCVYVGKDTKEVKEALNGFLDFTFEDSEVSNDEPKEVIVEAETVEPEHEAVEAKTLQEMSVTEMWAFCGSKGWDEAEYKRFKKPELIRKYIENKIAETNG